MQEKITNPFARLMGLRYKSHPWHGIDAGAEAPGVVKSFIEIVPSDTVKYEVDKESGYLMIDRPQKFSNIIPSLYGFIPQTYCGNTVAEKSRSILERKDIVGDGDPLDILILTEKEMSADWDDFEDRFPRFEFDDETESSQDSTEDGTNSSEENGESAEEVGLAD